MLKFIIRFKDKTSRELKNVINAVINFELDVPADDITLTVPYSGELMKNADYITVLQESETVFYGQIDEITDIKNGRSKITRLSARSLAAALLDNEAEPLNYYYPSANFIYTRHLKPFGIKLSEQDGSTYFDMLKIRKGMTHWQVFESYCINVYGSKPRITGGGKALFKGGISDETIVFGDKAGMIPYTYMKVSSKRYKLITEVKLKASAKATYLSSMGNDNPDCKGIKRVRYVDELLDKSSVNTARKIIENSNKNAYVIKLKCPGCHLNAAGKKAELFESEAVKGLYVRSVKYTLGAGGETTEVELGKESF